MFVKLFLLHIMMTERLWCPQGLQKSPQESPRYSQDPPKSFPRAPQERTNRKQKRPRSVQDKPTTPPNAGNKDSRATSIHPRADTTASKAAREHKSTARASPNTCVRSPYPDQKDTPCLRAKNKSAEKQKDERDSGRPKGTQQGLLVDTFMMSKIQGKADHPL